MSLIKVKDDQSIARDPINGGIVAIDIEAYNAHRKAKSAKRNIDDRLNAIEKDVSDIKAMFSEILSKLR